MIWILIIGCILLCGAMIITIMSDDSKTLPAMLCGFLSGATIMLYCLENISTEFPTAIDVYRGHTDIEVTYTIKDNDTIKCDTTIVFIEQYK